MASTSPSSIQLPVSPASASGALTRPAAAEDRSFSSLVIALLDQGLVARAREREIADPRKQPFPWFRRRPRVGEEAE